jgi:hypothetical protein
MAIQRFSLPQLFNSVSAAKERKSSRDKRVRANKFDWQQE